MVDVGIPRCGSQPLVEPAVTLIEGSRERRRGVRRAAQLPHGHRRCGRFDVAHTGDQLEGVFGATDRRTHGGQDADRERGQERDVDVLGEQVLEVEIGEFHRIVEQFAIGHRREVRPVRPQGVDHGFFGQHLGQVRGGEHPPERLGDLGGEVVSVEAGLHHELGHPGGVAEERGVDVVGGHARCAVSEHPQCRGVQIAVTVDHAEEDALVIGELVGGHHADAVVRTTEAHLGPTEPLVILEVEEAQGCDGVGEDLTDIGSGVEVELLVEIALDQPLFDHSFCPLDCEWAESSRVL